MILLDTHALIWLAGEPQKLSQKATSAIRQALSSGGLAISAITLWELAWLATYGRIHFAGTPQSFVERISSRVSVQAITPQIAVLACQLPESYSQDPCDRLIGATAIAEGVVLVTKDRNIRSSTAVRTIW